MNNTKYYSIEWRTYETHLSNTSKELLGEDVFTDVTLVSDDMKTVSAHRIILSKASGVLKQLLELIPSKSPLLYLKGISSANLNSILEFIYTGETKVPAERINEFIKASCDLEISELSTNMEYSDKNIDDSEAVVSTQNRLRKTGDSSRFSKVDVDKSFNSFEGKMVEEDVMNEQKENHKNKRKENAGRKINRVKITSKLMKKSDESISNACEPDKDSQTENNDLKPISAAKKETSYKVEDLSCFKCLEKFTEQILYLKHMPKCSVF